MIIAVRPSRRLALLLCAGHAAAAGALAAIEAPLWLAISLVLLITANGAACVRKFAMLRSRSSIVALEAGSRGAVHVQAGSGEWHEGTFLATSFVAPWLILLNVGTAGGPSVIHVVLLADSMEAGEFRRLRVLLRWARARDAG